jgi:hypothetical protein
MSGLLFMTVLSLSMMYGIMAVAGTDDQCEMKAQPEISSQALSLMQKATSMAKNMYLDKLSGKPKKVVPPPDMPKVMAPNMGAKAPNMGAKAMAPAPSQHPPFHPMPVSSYQPPKDDFAVKAPNMGAKTIPGPPPKEPAPNMGAKTIGAPNMGAKVMAPNNGGWNPNLGAKVTAPCTPGVDPGCGPDPNAKVPDPVPDPVPASCDTPQYEAATPYTRVGAFHCGICGQGWQPITSAYTCRWAAVELSQMTDKDVSKPERLNNPEMIELNAQVQDAAKGCTHYKGADREHKLVMRSTGGSYTQGTNSYWSLCIQDIQGGTHPGR